MVVSISDITGLIAMYHLGVCYKNGTGVIQNQITSCFWLERAASKGYEPASKLLKTLNFTKGIKSIKPNKRKASNTDENN